MPLFWNTKDFELFEKNFEKNLIQSCPIIDQLIFGGLHTTHKIHPI